MEAFETWWATQLTPPDDQRDWSQTSELSEELNAAQSELLPVLKMYALKGWNAAIRLTTRPGGG